jgi:hypothetical protein
VPFKPWQKNVLEGFLTKFDVKAEFSVALICFRRGMLCLQEPGPLSPRCHVSFRILTFRCQGQKPEKPVRLYRLDMSILRNNLKLEYSIVSRNVLKNDANLLVEAIGRLKLSYLQKLYKF